MAGWYRLLACAAMLAAQVDHSASFAVPAHTGGWACALRVCGAQRRLGARRSVRSPLRTGSAALSMAAGPRTDYYAVLGVDRKADAATIKKAYKKLAMKNHPDVNKDPTAKETFIKINEAYAVLSDEKERRKYDLGGANPFAGWSGSSSSSSRSGGYSGAPFDVDAFWNQYRPREETTKDINDSFGAIFDDLFGEVKKTAKKARSKSGAGRRSSILDDFGDFLEVMLDDDLADSVNDGEDIEELQIEIDDASYVIAQLKERVAKLKTDASSQEDLAQQWERKGSDPEIREKADSLKRTAKRLYERAVKVKEMQNKQQTRLDQLKEKLRELKSQGGRGPSAGAAASSSSPSSAAGKVVVDCPQCSQKLRVPASASGKPAPGVARCPACSHSFEPAPAPSAETEAQRTTPGEQTSAEKVVVECPACGQKLRVPAGKRGVITCPACSKTFESEPAATSSSSSSSSSTSSSGPRSPASAASPRNDWRNAPASGPDTWAEQQKMKQELARAKAEEELDNLKKQMGL